jgi:hypothetical protein
MRSVSAAHQARRADYARAAITRFSQRQQSSHAARERVYALRLKVLLAALALGVGLAGYGLNRWWLAQRKAEAELARITKQENMQQRAARRFAELKVPTGGNVCLSYQFDNFTGGWFDQNVVRCFDPEASDARSLTSDYGPAARARALSNAFRN